LNETQISKRFQTVHRLRIDPSVENETHLYAATLGSLSRSTDGGSTWSTLFGGNPDSSSLYTDVEIAHNGTIYASIGAINMHRKPSDTAGIFRSEDGENWTDITPEDFPRFHIRTVMDIYESNSNVAYFLSYAPIYNEANHSLFRFEQFDSSYAWENMSDTIPYDTTDAKMMFNSQSAYDLTIGVKPDDENYVFIGGVNLYRTTDGFQNPEEVQFIGGQGAHGIVENTWVDHHRILFSRYNPNEMYIGNDGGVKRTIDCTSEEVVWEDMSTNYVTSQFYTIAINEISEQSDLIVGGLQDRDIKFTDKLKPNSPWYNFDIGDGTYTAVSDDDRYFYVSNQNTMILRVESQTGEHKRVDPELSGGIQLWVNPFILDPNDDDVLYIASRLGVVRVNNLTSITESSTIDFEVIPQVHGESRISALSISREIPNILTYGTEDGKLFQLENSNTSLDEAAELTSDIFPENGFVSSIHTDPFDYQKLTVTFSNYNVISIFHSTDGGETWKNVSGNLEENPDGSGAGPSVRWITSLKKDSSKIYYAATSAGLYSTNNIEEEDVFWQKEGRGTIGSAVVSMVKARDSDGLVVASTHGVGVFAKGFDNSVTSFKNNIVKKDYRLEQNYPNPFNPTTNISFSLPKESHVSLKVYDPLGREVAELVYSEKQAGSHIAEFDASNYASGVYYYRLEVDDYTQTKKMILLR
jgi:photosystem II stability/assembly factor-like uncharacterized protein